MLDGKLRRVVAAILLCVPAFLALTYESTSAQGSLTTVFETPAPSGAPGEDHGRAQRMKEGWDSLWGRGAGGTMSGKIGESLPPPEVSRRASEQEARRAEMLRADIERVKNAPLPLDGGEFLKRYVTEKDLSGLDRYRQTQNPDDLYVPWKTTDAAVKRQLAPIYYKLRTYQPKNEAEVHVAQLGLEGVRLADESYAEAKTADANFYFSIAKASADILVGLDPITGTLRSVYEAATGLNMITGVQLSAFERGLAVFGVVTFGYGQKISTGLGAVQRIVARSRLGGAAWDAALTYAKHFGDTFPKFTALGASAEDALVRYASILREASDGPRRRMAHFATGTGDLEDAILRRHPEVYKLDKGSFNLPERVPGAVPVTFTKSEADALGAAWAGPGFRKAGGGAAYVGNEQGRLRHVYRQPAEKEPGVWQANLELHVRDNGNFRQLTNYHIDVSDR